MDYSIYTMRLFEKIKYIVIGTGGLFLLAFLFYDSIIIGVLISFGGIYYLPYKKKNLIKERKKRLKHEFKEGLYALSSSISVGKSIELAFIEALYDLSLIYDNRESLIIKEFELIVRKIAMNESIESALLDFAFRAEDEDITNFTNVFISAKRSGGNLVEIMKYTNTVINEKIEIVDHIQVLITSKKYEQRILALLVPFMIVYLQLFSAGFLDVMYKTAQGRIAMTVALILYIISFIISKKVVDIEV